MSHGEKASDLSSLRYVACNTVDKYAEPESRLSERRHDSTVRVQDKNQDKLM